MTQQIKPCLNFGDSVQLTEIWLARSEALCVIKGFILTQIEMGRKRYTVTKVSAFSVL